MIFKETRLGGVYTIDPMRHEDERGFFARTFCAEDFEKRGLVGRVRQSSVSYNPTGSTLRGMHYQVGPTSEVKLIRCTRGSIWDCLIDLRPESPTFKKWTAATLSAENRRLFYAPKGIAHGFLTLEPDTEVFYEISDDHAPQAARGVRWDDPAFNIEWPNEPKLISKRDQEFANFEP